MSKGRILQLSIFVVFFVFFLSGCARLKYIDEKLGEFLNNPQDFASSTLDRKSEDRIDYRALTQKDKRKIEAWLKEKNLNRFGDSVDTYYAGGTPLFNEKTGESTERFEYILKKHPELLKIINK